jgi:hypothetical protein
LVKILVLFPQQFDQFHSAVSLALIRFFEKAKPIRLKMPDTIFVAVAYVSELLSQGRHFAAPAVDHRGYR